MQIINNMSLGTISAHIAALRESMDVVVSGTTPDHAKWTSVNNFVRKYTELALQYISLTGDTNIGVYDVEKLKNPFDMVWPAQKALFDTIYTDTLILQRMVIQAEAAISGPLYNLFVSASEDSWQGEPFQIELSRCVREYTSPHLTRRFGNLDALSIKTLKNAPSIFAYEAGCKLSPKFGYIRDIVHRGGQVRIEYDIQNMDQFLSYADIEEMTFELDIQKLELHRTHWAVKEVNLPKELHSKGITLPASMQNIANAVDVSKHTFDVALSFPGETRPLVEKIVEELEKNLGPNRYFYDNNYVSQLAQPSLDVLLQGIYTRAKLDVVFLSADYQNKDWCGVEFRAIKEIIFTRDNNRIMFVKTDDGEVSGVFKTDGYIDARKFTPSEIAKFIVERITIRK
ncbi:TIR domain-containing protein [Pedobacter panaciterrae]